MFFSRWFETAAGRWDSFSSARRHQLNQLLVAGDVSWAPLTPHRADGTRRAKTRQWKTRSYGSCLDRPDKYGRLMLSWGPVKRWNRCDRGSRELALRRDTPTSTTGKSKRPRASTLPPSSRPSYQKTLVSPTSIPKGDTWMSQHFPTWPRMPRRYRPGKPPSTGAGSRTTRSVISMP